MMANADDAIVNMENSAHWRIVQTVPVGLPPFALEVDQRRGRVVVLMCDILSSCAPAGRVQILDGRTGRLLHTVAVPLGPGALVVDARTGAVVVAHAYDNSVSLVDAAGGRVVRTLPLGLPPYALAVDQRRGRIVVLTRASPWPSTTATADLVTVLDGRTGRLMHTVAIGADASALALDGRTGHAFAAAMNVYGRPANSDNTGLLRTWLGRWLPRRWVSRFLPPAPVTTTGTVTMLDLARLWP